MQQSLPKAIFVSLFIAFASTQAAVTYVDAVADSAVGPVNTVASSGAALSSWYDGSSPTANIAINDKWTRRSAVGYGNGADDILQARTSTANAIPQIKTTISGLTPDSYYEVYVFFWDADGGEAWNVDAGLATDSLQNYSGDGGGVLLSADGSAGTLTYTNGVPMTTSGNREMLYGILGTIQADGSGEIDVYVDNTLHTSASSPRRSWYDGVGFEEVSGPTQLIETYVDAIEANTVAAGGAPSPFSTAVQTTDNLWRKRTGFGFDVNGNTEVYEKDATGGVGDAASLETTISGLTPGQEYGVYVCFLSVPTEAWRVKAGLDSNNLIEFHPTSDPNRLTDLGTTSVSGSNRNQYLGFIGNTNAAPDGTIMVHVDDGDGSGNTTRTWYEGVGVGPTNFVPVVVTDPVPEGAVEVAPDGVWTWFNDERSIWHQGYLYSGYVRADGHVGLSRYDPATGNRTHVQLSTAQSQQVDDHNNCSISTLPDGRLLVVYGKHNSSWNFFSRTSKVLAPASLSDWNVEKVKTLPASNTYANTYRLPAEANTIYNFHRCINFDPTITISTDNGETWGTPTHFIDAGNQWQRPYPRYCSNHDDRVDLIYTDGHPRDANNSIYHMYYQGGNFRKTDGTLISSFANLPIDHDIGERGSVVYSFSTSAWGAGDGPDDWIPGARGWTWDVCYGSDSNPICVFQVQNNDVTGSGWTHDRIYYYYARWTGTEWQRRFIAHGGHGIYNAERDYGGGMALDPDDPRIIYISSNAADPFDLSSITSVPLNADSRYEIYRGFTADGGLTFEWTPVTTNSPVDNLRPIVPENHGRIRHLVWFYGNYITYQNYDCQVVSIIDDKKETLPDWQSLYGVTNAPVTNDSDSDGLSDLAEYALGGNPTNALDTPMPQLNDEEYTFSHLPLRTDIESSVEVSTNLTDSSWDEVITIRNGGLPNTTTNGFTLGSEGGDPEQLSVSLNPETNGPALFMRLNIRTL